MKKILALTLGIVTSIGGFLEVGSIATAAQGGAAFRFQLGWSVLLGTVCLIFLVEMSGRLAALSKHTVMDAIRERFGFQFSVVPLFSVLFVSFLVLTSEVGGVCLALQYVTGIGFRWWALPVVLLVWTFMWKGTFSVVEKVSSLLGLVTLCFLVAAVRMHPNWGAVTHGLLPTLPRTDAVQYWFLAVSILGASITPYLFLFYSSGAVEDRWDASYLNTNRVSATLGMTFGGGLSLVVLVVGAMAFFPAGIRIDTYDQVALMLTGPLGRAGFRLFAASLGIACFGAASEISLASAYVVAQEFGWNWSKDVAPCDASRFSVVYSAVILLSAVPMLVGLDPLKVTMFSMALTAATLPAAIVPFLVIMNDERYVKGHTNGWVSNSAVVIIMLLSFVLAVVSIPLEILGS